MADDGIHSLGDPRIAIILTGVGSAAFVIAIYHCISVGWCNRHLPTPSPPQPRTFMPQIIELPSGIENSMAQLIPAHKYHKGMGLVSEDGLCAVCLCEFEEGEELRTLPECLHSYHAPCIDMWLYSHSNCPMCRTDAAPSPQIFRPPDIRPEELDSGMLQIIVPQSRATILM